MRAFFTTAVLFAAAHLLRAEALDFSVTIAENRQQAPSGGDRLLPYIFLPADTTKREPMSGALQNPKPSQSFYVVIQNKAATPVRLNLWMSEWHYCLGFEIRTADGKTFPIHRGGSVWTVNAPFPWLFEPGGLMVCTIDFASGGWDGLPSAQELPKDQPFQIKATFQFPYGEGKKPLTFESADTTAVSGRIETPPGN